MVTKWFNGMHKGLYLMDFVLRGKKNLGGCQEKKKLENFDLAHLTLVESKQPMCSLYHLPGV